MPPKLKEKVEPSRKLTIPVPSNAPEKFIVPDTSNVSLPAIVPEIVPRVKTNFFPVLKFTVPP